MLKSPKFKSAILTSMILLSVSCFVYVNTNIETKTNVANTLTVENAQDLKDTRTPDIKFVSSVLHLIGNFITAK